MNNTNQLILLGLYCILRRMMDANIGGDRNNGSSLERKFLAEAHREVFPEAAPSAFGPVIGAKR